VGKSNEHAIAESNKTEWLPVIAMPFVGGGAEDPGGIRQLAGSGVYEVIRVVVALPP